MKDLIHDPTPNEPLILLKSLKTYLKDYRYEIEYYLEGFAIRFFDQNEENHMIVIFFDFEKSTYEISSFYADKSHFKTTDIPSNQELTQIALKYFLKLELIEGVRIKRNSRIVRSSASRFG